MIGIVAAVLLLALVLAVTVALGATDRSGHGDDPGRSGDGAGGVATAPGAGGRSTPLLVAAAVLVVGVVALVVTVGVERPPALEPLTGDGAGPGASVAWTEPSEVGGPVCLWVGRPDGVLTELTCEVELDEVVGWSEEGIVARSWADPRPQLVLVDADTGEVVERRREDPDALDPGDPDAADPWLDDPWSDHLGDHVSSRREGDELVVVARDDRELWRVEASERYDVGPGTASPDGRWIAAVDAASRLLLLPADGSTEPRVWAEDVPRWVGVVWEADPADGA
jgi:hypothetical protein